MKRNLFIFVLSAAASMVVCGAQAETPESAPRSTPKVIAHRGFWNTGGAAKNSIEALRNSLALGCWGTEFDVWVTRDGVPVVFHDAHTANGIEIQHATLDSLMRHADRLSNGERIPTLAEYLGVWNHSPVKLILELKSHADAQHDDRAAEIVHETLRTLGVEPREVEFIAFSRHAVRAFTSRHCGSPVAYLEGDLAPRAAHTELGADGIDYNKGTLRKHPEWIPEAREGTMTVNVWTVNSEADMRHFIDAGVDYITTDRPDVAMKMLSEKATAKP